MKLKLEDIKKITTGAVKITEENSKFVFSRFTDEQLELYKKFSKENDKNFDEKCKASSGIKMKFKTNSLNLGLKVDILPSTSRKYFAFDVFVDGKMIGNLNNFEDVTLPIDYTEVELPLGTFSKEFFLGEGEKEVTVYFPWSVQPIIEELTLDNGSYFEEVKAKKTLLAFGDSITQGYDALHPSLRYACQLCNKLKVDEVNKGIGGEVFFPALAKAKDDISPDYITVAYGTNDFSRSSEEDFKVRCKDFFTALSENYPDSKIFAITPIWRSDYKGPREFGAFEKVEEHIKNTVEPLENVVAISGFDLVPKDEKFYSDLRLHPNDNGFMFYADNLYNEIAKEDNCL